MAFSLEINSFLTCSKSIIFSTFRLSFSLKKSIPSGKIIALETSPKEVFLISSLRFLGIVFSFTHPIFPPSFPDSEILNFNAVLSNPSVFIKFFILSISLSNSEVET